ncbi:MAG: hypothetical protein KJ655_04460 [Candidatus Thermoplasmatota archaeon]|nr:hypothetical protein [Candidatus Thermoplasmatota archaeon]
MSPSERSEFGRMIAGKLRFPAYHEPKHGKAHDLLKENPFFPYHESNTTVL